MNRYDVIVVGGGPAGLSAAYAAARAGLRVVLFERSKEIGYPIHTSGGSWIADLKELGIPGRYIHPITRGIFLSPRARAAFVYDDPVGCVLDVRGLYQYLAVEAVRADYRARVLIDASGMAGVLATQFGLRPPFARFGVGIEVDVMSDEWPRDTATLLFGSLAGPSGYGWVFPHGDGRVRLGIGVIKPDAAVGPRALLDKLLRRREIGGYPLASRGQLETHMGAIPATPPLRRASGAGLLVVGDAGALISTLLGEGIRFAIAIGRMAGAIAAAAHRVGDFSGRFLSRFDGQWHRTYGRLFELDHIINRRLATYDDAAWDRNISLLSHLPPAAVPPLLRGELTAASALIGLFSQPRLWRYALRRRFVVSRQSS